MTAASSERLAVALEEAGQPDLAARARDDEFHAFRSRHALPDHVLDGELVQRQLIGLSQQVRHGEFDATREEAREWATSVDGQEAMRQQGVPLDFLVGHLDDAAQREIEDAERGT